MVIVARENCFDPGDRTARNIYGCGERQSDASKYGHPVSDLKLSPTVLYALATGDSYEPEIAEALILRRQRANG